MLGVHKVGRCLSQEFFILFFSFLVFYFSSLLGFIDYLNLNIMYLYHLERRGGKGRDWGPGVGRGKGRGGKSVSHVFFPFGVVCIYGLPVLCLLR